MAELTSCFVKEETKYDYRHNNLPWRRKQYFTPSRTFKQLLCSCRVFPALSEYSKFIPTTYDKLLLRLYVYRVKSDDWLDGAKLKLREASYYTHITGRRLISYSLDICHMAD
jgi:hypothetical protein